MASYEIKKEYNYTISIFRIIAIIFVVTCHIGTELNNGLIAQFFDSGVQFFLFISGYLYGRKSIDNASQWIKGRYIRITIPCIVYVAICTFISLSFRWAFSIASLVLYIFNVEGYYHFFEFLPTLDMVPGTQHLWFITVLFICYGLMIILKTTEYENKLIKNKKWLYLITFISFILTYFGVRIDYVLVFFIGYYISNIEYNINMKNTLISAAFMIVMCFSRLLVKRYCDENGDIALYTQIIIPITYISITVCSFFLLSLFMKKKERMNAAIRLLKIPAIRKMDELSFYIYVSHYILLGNQLSVFRSSISIYAKLLVFIIEIIIAGLILEAISKPVIFIAKEQINN